MRRRQQLNLGKARLGAGLPPTGRVSLVQRPSWIWAALPAESHRIMCVDDFGLAAALREAGLEVVTGEDRSNGETRPDAVVVAEGAPGAAQKAARGAQEATTGVAAIAVGPSANPSLRPVSRPARALHVLASPLTTVSTQTAARRLERAMTREGLDVATVRTGDRSLPRYGLGPGGWAGRRRLPGGAIVIGSTGRRPPSVLQKVIAESARELRRPLKRLSADVFPSGKLAVQLAGPGGERYFLSITTGDASSLSRSETAIRAILDADPPSSLSERIVAPLAAGSVGPVRYVLEPKAPGRHPVWMTAELWDQCVELLADLHQLPRRSPDLSLPAMWPDLPTAIEILGRQAHRDDRPLLGRIHRAIDARVAGLELGGGHGDFFTQNLMVGRGRLRAVLDWEWAARDALPLLDLLDLRAQLGWRRRRGLRIGENFTEILWPLARQGGDGPVRAYCQAVGAPADTDTLEGLAMAHWLLRTARLGSINARRLEDAGWWRANVAAPMARIKEDGRGWARTARSS